MTILRELIAQHAAALAVYGDDYEQIAALLNAPTVVANTQKDAYEVPQPATLDDVLAIVPSAERVKIRGLSGYVDDVRRAIDTGNTLYMQTLIEDALTAQAISAWTASKLAELLQRTQTVTPPATVAGPSIAAAAGLGRVTAAQVQGAMN